MISSFVIWARLVTRIQHRASPAQHTTATHHSSLWKYNLYQTRLPVLSIHLLASVPQSGDSTLQQPRPQPQDIKVCLHRNITTQTSHQLILPRGSDQMAGTFQMLVSTQIHIQIQVKTKEQRTLLKSLAQRYSDKIPTLLYQPSGRGCILFHFMKEESERFQVSTFPCLT